jgi:hypothetical protein
LTEHFFTSFLANFYQNKHIFAKNTIMTSTEIQNSLIRDILTIQNPQVLKKLKVFLMQIVEEEKVVISDYDKKIIETGISQVNEGLFFTDEEVIQKTNKWLGE